MRTKDLYPGIHRVKRHALISPRVWENGHVEGFNGKLRDELLHREMFYTQTEAKVLFERWRLEHDTR